jgi:acyl-CoA thioester hydrolase
VHEKWIEIRWRDIDAFGHVNNAVFLTYLEECRDEFMAAALEGVGDANDFVLARVAIDYRRPLTQADDRITVRCRLDGLGRASVRTSEEILTASGEVAAAAESVMVPLAPGGAGSRPLTEAERRSFEARR